MSHRCRSWKSLIVAVVMGLFLFGRAPYSIGVQEVSAQFQPVPPGYKVVYVFPGLRATGNSVASTVHCTNLDNSKTAEILVEFYSFGSGLQGSSAVTAGPGQTATVSADQDGFTTFYAEDATVPLSGLAQGSARVLVSGTTRIACTAQVLDSANMPPTFVYTVPHFSRAGKH